MSVNGEEKDYYKIQSTSVGPDKIPGLFPFKKIAPKKTRVERITEVCGSMHAQELLSKVQVMKDQGREKEEKRNKNAILKKLSCIAKILLSVHVRVKEYVQQLV